MFCELSSQELIACRKHRASLKRSALIICVIIIEMTDRDLKKNTLSV